MTNPQTIKNGSSVKQEESHVFSVDLCSTFIRNCKKINYSNQGSFSVFLNDDEMVFSKDDPIIISSKISELFSKDITIRSFNVNINFRSKESKTKIIAILQTSKYSSKVSPSNEDELFDFFEFGFAFGSSVFTKPFILFAENQNKEAISNSNVINRIELKDILSLTLGKDYSVEQELE